jgi:hypothetical protein
MTEDETKETFPFVILDNVGKPTTSERNLIKRHAAQGKGRPRRALNQKKPRLGVWLGIEDSPRSISFDGLENWEAGGCAERKPHPINSVRVWHSLPVTASLSSSPLSSFPGIPQERLEKIFTST